VWDGRGPLYCSGMDRWVGNNLDVNVKSAMVIRADGMCEVTCTGCTLSGPTVVEAHGQAKVNIVGGTIKGDSYAVRADGASKVNLTTARVSGRKDKSGLASIE
jgi:hypothetical protein